ncbi:hypothetical protein HV87_24865 [Pseudomonas aeruginosa]|nr:hypothetical protein HV87_24865 [Pseudomonas aeruginosa]
MLRHGRRQARVVDVRIGGFRWCWNVHGLTSRGWFEEVLQAWTSASCDSLSFFCFTMTPAPHFAGLRQGSIQQVYQSLRRVQHMPVLSET